MVWGRRDALGVLSELPAGAAIDSRRLDPSLETGLLRQTRHRSQRERRRALNAACATPSERWEVTYDREDREGGVEGERMRDVDIWSELVSLGISGRDAYPVSVVVLKTRDDVLVSDFGAFVVPGEDSRGVSSSPLPEWGRV